MNKYQESLDDLEFKAIQYENTLKGYEWDDCAIEVQNDFEALQELVDRAIPKKLDYEGDGYWDGELVHDTAICRNCERRFEVDHDEHSKFCPSCGQALDWSK